MINNKGALELILICPDPVIGVDRQGLVNLFNPAAQRLLGYQPDEVLGKLNIADCYHPSGEARRIKKLIYGDEYGARGHIEGYETAVLDSQGREIPIRISATVLLEEQQEVGSIGFFHDLSAHKDAEARLRLLSITDNLTGLYNQRHFHHVLANEMKRSERYQHPLSMVCVDIDNFKQVNDRFGHLAGDQVIRNTAVTQRDILRISDVAFRYGGDEFIVLLPETGINEALVIAERVRTSVSQLCNTAEVDDKIEEITVTLSLGVTELNAGELPKDFLSRADQSMYRAKRKGGNQLYSC